MRRCGNAQTAGRRQATPGASRARRSLTISYSSVAAQIGRSKEQVNKAQPIRQLARGGTCSHAAQVHEAKGPSSSRFPDRPAQHERRLARSEYVDLNVDVATRGRDAA